MPMRTVEIDLAAKPKKTAVCVIDWAAGRVDLAPGGLTDEQLVESVLQGAMTGAIRVAGRLPRCDLRASCCSPLAHRASRSRGDPRQALRFRRTDLVLIGGGHKPLSVTSDKIAVLAMRCAGLQHQMSLAGMISIAQACWDGCARCTQPPRSGRGDLRIAAISVLRTDLRWRIWPRRSSAPAGTLSFTDTARVRCAFDGNCLDALICALTARAQALRAYAGPEHSASRPAAPRGMDPCPHCPVGCTVQRPLAHPGARRDLAGAPTGPRIGTVLACGFGGLPGNREPRRPGRIEGEARRVSLPPRGPSPRAVATYLRRNSAAHCNSARKIG